MRLYEIEIESRLLLGTSQYPSPAILSEAVRASGAGIVTVSLRREAARLREGQDFWRLIRELGVRVLPNTAGCHSVKEAMTTAEMAREIFDTAWIKLEVIGEADTLQPDVFGLVEAARNLSADGFEVFHLQTWDNAAGAWREAEAPLWKLAVKSEIQPLLLAYFKLNDWQKMNGSVSVKVVRILPMAWPVALGSGGETLEDPDETDLMRAAEHGDFTAVQQLLTAGGKANVNALDQSGQTALIRACQDPKVGPAVVKALLASGADVNLRSRAGYTALTWAQARNNSEVIRLLRRAGGRP